MSNDNKSWIIIDRRYNCDALNEDGAKCVFNIQNVNEGFYRFVRLRQTGLGWGIEKYTTLMSICYIDFYGRLLTPQMM